MEKKNFSFEDLKVGDVVISQGPYPPYSVKIVSLNSLKEEFDCIVTFADGVRETHSGAFIHQIDKPCKLIRKDSADKIKVKDMFD